MTEFYRLPDAIAVAPLKGKKLVIVRDTGDSVTVTAADDRYANGYRYLRSDLQPWVQEKDAEHIREISEFVLIKGNPFEPTSTDEIVQRVTLDIGLTPAGEGWRILTGNERTNLWARIAYRYEIEE